MTNKHTVIIQRGLYFSGVAMLYLLVKLPFPILTMIGNSAGRILMCFAKKRRTRVKERIAHYCPHLTANEQSTLIREYFKCCGMQPLEAAMAGFWPDRRVKKWCTISGLEHLTTSEKGTLLITPSFFAMELSVRAINLYTPTFGAYLPLNSTPKGHFLTRIRHRIHQHVIGKGNVHLLAMILKNRGTLCYTPTKEDKKTNCIIVSKSNASQTTFTSVVSTLMNTAQPVLTLVTPQRKNAGKGYHIVIRPPRRHYPYTNPGAADTYLRRLVKDEIKRSPAQYKYHLADN